ncbi:hypothetical protein Tco_1237847 [Tanacetum coccineum]
MKYKPKKQVYQVVFKKNGASSSGTKKNFEVPALNMIDNDDELGSNGGRQIQLGLTTASWMPARSGFIGECGIAEYSIKTVLD